MLRNVLMLGLVACAGYHAVKYPTGTTAREVSASLRGRWPALPATVEMLAITPDSPWGKPTVEWGPTVAHHYLFRSASSGPYGVLHGDAPLAIDSIKAHVVELSIRDSQPGMIVTAASYRVVDANPTRALDDAAARWQRYLVAQQPAIEKALADADRATPGRVLGPETTHAIDGFAPTWIAGDRKIVVVYARSVTRESSLSEQRKTAPCTKYDRFRQPSFPDRVSCPQMPDFQTITTTRRFGATMALVLEYSANGELQSERPVAPEAEPGRGPQR